ncbi:MAG: hypothetical protein B7Z08_00250 [Sphingomonadales bacterium 32-68-7]|nr:MAG: hypothetical protein B7Z33_09325 [Sphingomonadales bacterium 12-68-11]OYX10565.1 MAG: hypothetical protein B7Z08_00250 [Sphingomonadales bacterium 32-68-7]
MIAQLPSILWQRRWFMVIPAVLGVIAAVAAAFLLPTQYQSTAVLLVQSPSLPEDVIGTGTRAAIDQRIEAIRQQIINRPALVGIIEANQLYTEERANQPLSQLIEKMREDITLIPEESVVGTNSLEDQTISVRLAFTYSEPTKAQAVAQQLMERVVEVNSTATTAQRTQTVRFLEEQQAELQRQIQDAESQVTALNARFGGVLSTSGSTMIASSGTYDIQIAALERENAALRNQRETAASADTRDPALVAAEAQLAAARAVYADNHPDVILARQRLAQARQFAQQNQQRLPLESIDRQIAFNDSQITALRAGKAREDAQTSSVIAERSRVPAIQQEAAQMQQRLQTLYEQAEAISDRLLSARAGARADEEQMGERLLVVDPPVIPDTPVSPNRPLIIALGIAGGLGAGLVLAMAVEFFLHPIRDPQAVAAITGVRPLAMVPVIATKRGYSRRGWPFGKKRKPPRRRRKRVEQ